MKYNFEDIGLQGKEKGQSKLFLYSKNALVNRAPGDMSYMLMNLHMFFRNEYIQRIISRIEEIYL